VGKYRCLFRSIIYFVFSSLDYQEGGRKRLIT
jgi:hypothetical protein